MVVPLTPKMMNGLASPQHHEENDEEPLSPSQRGSAKKQQRLRPLRVVQVVGVVVMVAISMVNFRVSSRVATSETSNTLKHHMQGWSSSSIIAATPAALPVRPNNDAALVLQPPATLAAAAQLLPQSTTSKTMTVDPNVNTTALHTQIFEHKAPWRASTILPPWIKDYIAWHQQQRAALTADNWNNGTFQFLVVRCIKEDSKCGGTADRLKPLPFYMLVAKEMNRILLFWWEKPAPLEAFLLPPEDGLDWRLPAYIVNQVGLTQQLRVGVPHLHGGQKLQQMLGYREPNDENPTGRKVRRVPHPTDIILTTKFQSHGHGAHEYNNLRVHYPYPHPKTNETMKPLNVATKDEDVEPTYEQVFRDVWYSTFIPVPAIQQRMANEMNTLGLQRNKFQAIHIRSRYASTMSRAKIQTLCRNALHCIYLLDAQKASTTPIYVSADHRHAVWATLQYSRELSLPHVTARDAELVLSLNETEAEQETSTLHLDRGTNHLARKPKDWTAHHFEAEDYYDTFVDLYVLSQADCITINVGNYGKWANLLSDNPSCEVSHMKLTCPRSAVIQPPQVG